MVHIRLKSSSTLLPTPPRSPQVCDTSQLPLPQMRLLMALYTSLFGMLAVLLNVGWLVQHVRRSVEEVFNFFVAFYFIFQALKNLLEVSGNGGDGPNDVANITYQTHLSHTHTLSLGWLTYPPHSNL